MPFVSSFILLIQLSIILIFVFSCTKMNVKIFNHNSKNEQNIVASICKKTDASHFTVQNMRVILKMEVSRVVESLFMKMEIHIMAIGMKVNEVVKVFGNQAMMNLLIKVTGKKACLME